TDSICVYSLCSVLVLFTIFLSTIAHLFNRIRRTPTTTLFPYTTLFRSRRARAFDMRVLYTKRARLREDEEAALGVEYRELDQLRSEEHTSELQSRVDLVCRLLLEIKNN